ncbi:formimidoylglutamate deiminase [Methylobacterium sp. 391_Methyba4]|uniref:formimidoylglutamate deiminase n=1 Tax=Methylobacterium sp. 391_Methyba4 TaxID=3038924 RepID=UPI00241D6532|nr:formimidoylglutamate deiminase [Methylobacterium sp. 391_Methyba4]WFS10654.1 formimidoylglutamate deiminase [Methylobacterium sp. 391_Methyba4]
MTILFFDVALLPTGWASDVRITIRDGHIADLAVGTGREDDDEHHRIGLPGLGNLHSHAFQRGMAGLAEVRGPSSDSFWTWREVMYRFVGRMDADDLEAVAAQAYVEMLESGFTRVGEFHYLHHDAAGAPHADIAELAGRIVAAAQAAGIGLTLLPVFYAHAGFGGRPPEAGQRRFVTDVDGFGRLIEVCRRIVADCDGGIVGIAPHSLRAVTPAELATILPLAQGGPVHIHVAEQIAEVEACRAWSGRRPVEWLLDNAPVDAAWCLIHATHTVPAELAGVAARGAVIGLCPVTEANLGDGTFDGPNFAASGGVYGIGSDSNVLIDAASELRQFEYSQRLAGRARNVMAAGASTGRALFDAALCGGRQALGVGIGGVRVGAAADLISLNARHVALVGRAGDAILDSWIFGARQGSIDCVWVGGRKRVENGRHLGSAAIATRFRRTLEGLLAA